MSEPLLLDTHAAIWWMAGEPITKASRDAIDGAAETGPLVMISPISAWEVALAAARGRIKLPAGPRVWYSRLLSLPGFSETPLSADILVASENLPEPLHRDPADRFLIATARYHSLILVTRDRKILDYGAGGHVATLAC